MSRKINTEFVNPPIPARHMDWVATFDGYEPGGLIAYGRTKEAAETALRELADLDDHVMTVEEKYRRDEASDANREGRLG